MLYEFAHHLCAGAMLIFFVLFPIFVHGLPKQAQVVFLTTNLVIEYVFNLLFAR